MSKTRIFLMEAGVVLEQVNLEKGRNTPKEYTVSSGRTEEVWQSRTLEEALEDYNAELDRCKGAALQR